MPFLIALAGIAAAIVWYIIRARNAAEAAGDLVDMANDVRLAARRFGFRRRSAGHPVEDIEDANLAIAAAAIAFQELDGLPTQEDRDLLTLQLRKVLRMQAETAEEAVVIGRWLVAQCGTADAALARLTRKLYKLDGTASLEPLMDVIKGSLPNGLLSVRQRDALETVTRTYKLK